VRYDLSPRFSANRHGCGRALREPSVNIGVGNNKGAVPHVTGADFRKLYGINDGSPSAYALTYDDFSALAKGYGRVGGLDRVATVINAIRAARPDALLLDGGDTWHGSYTCHQTQGQDMVNVMNALKPDAMTFHWEFTLGSDRVAEIVEGLPFAALGQNIFHNGFDVDKQMAGKVTGLDVILSGHTHDALPEPVLVGETIIVASGSNGKFVSRVDLDVRDGRMMGFRHKLIPIFSDVIAPDAEVSAVIDAQRAPYIDTLQEVIGRTADDQMLYRRGNFNGTWDDLICDALISEREADIALSPGVRWGPSILPGQDITREDIWNVTSMSYGEAYRTEMTGEFLHVVLEDVADNLFNPDPYYQQGGDMVRVGGLGYRIDVTKPQGDRITEMTLLKTGEAIDPAKTYQVAGWASVNEGTEGPAIWDVVEAHIAKQGTISLDPNNSVKVVGA